MRDFLINAPNLARHEVVPVTDGYRGVKITVRGAGKILLAKFYPLIHLGCGAAIACLLTRRDYENYKNAATMVSRSRYCFDRGTVYCPDCRVRGGKAIRTILKAQSQLTNFHTLGVERTSWITSRVTFPNGLGMDSKGKIVSYDEELVEVLGDAENVHGDPDF